MVKTSKLPKAKPVKIFAEYKVELHGKLLKIFFKSEAIREFFDYASKYDYDINGHSVKTRPVVREEGSYYKFTTDLVLRLWFLQYISNNHFNSLVITDYRIDRPVPLYFLRNTELGNGVTITFQTPVPIPKYLQRTIEQQLDTIIKNFAYFLQPGRSRHGHSSNS